MVFLSFDIDIAGEAAGIIIQISAEIVWLKLGGEGVGKNHIKDMQCSLIVFNSYICPWTEML